MQKIMYHTLDPTFMLSALLCQSKTVCFEPVYCLQVQRASQHIYKMLRCYFINNELQNKTFQAVSDTVGLKI